MPYRSPIFRKLLFSAFLLIAVSLFILDFYLTRYTAQRERELTEEQLARDARILAGELVHVPPAAVNEWAHEAAERASLRITVISPEGVVLADSERDPAAMENHGDRPEIREAHQGRIGFSTRRSASVDVDFSYAAYPLTYDGQPGHVLRLALPTRELQAAIAEVRWRILGASAVAAGIALMLAYIFTRSFTRRVRRLQEFAGGLTGKRVADKLPPDSDDELGALAASLSSASAQLRGLVDRLSLESSRREAILSSMAEGVLAVDGELRVTFCNDAFARAVGARMPVPERLPLLELVRDPDFLDLLTRVLATGRSVQQRLQLTPGGRSFEVVAGPLAAPSRWGAIAILHDITEIERLERIRKDFVANVSHELRTPLTAIRGYAETLLDGAIDDQEHNRKFLEIIRAHAIRLNNIASDLLVLSEIESGHQGADPEPVSIRAALDAALRTVESEARLRNVRLRTGRVEPAEVMGYRVRLEQALVNLLDNAVKFTRPGGEVQVEAIRTPDGKARITVSDTGIGIASEDLPRIFERFYRVDKARSREAGGTGLGLSIVKHVVERMGGAITVESQLGKGSAFTVTLPAC